MLPEFYNIVVCVWQFRKMSNVLRDLDVLNNRNELQHVVFVKLNIAVTIGRKEWRYV